MSGEMQKVGNVTFRIADSNLDMEFVWKDGVLYLTLHNVMVTDGNLWYEIPIKDLENIETDGESISFVVKSMTLSMKGRNAERLMALRHLLLPIINGSHTDRPVADLVKLMLLGIDDRNIMASLMKKDLSEIERLIEEAENEGFIENWKVTEKGRNLLSKEDLDLIEETEVHK